MAKVYKYKVIDIDGAIREGASKADSREEMLNAFKSRGQKPIKLEEQDQAGSVAIDSAFFSRSPGTKQLIMFCRQLYTMLNAGMPLISGLEVLTEQTQNKKMVNALQNITTNVKKGLMLSEAMNRFPKIFPVLLINMVQAGEMTGELDNVLRKMAVHYDKENKINSKITRAMIYPTVLVILAISAVVFLLTYVLPTIVSLFTGSGVMLPWPTRVVLGLSDALRSYWYLFIAVILLIIFSYKTFVNTQSGKKIRDKVVLHLPLIKRPMKKIVVSRFIRTLSTLLSSGIPIIKALKTSAKVTNNEVMIEKIDDVSENIKKGDSLSNLLGEIDLFPRMTVSMIKIGEESGAIDDMLEKTADYYDDELEASLEKLVALVEPIGILAMGLIIGFIVVAMVLPMFDMFKTI